MQHIVKHQYSVCFMRVSRVFVVSFTFILCFVGVFHRCFANAIAHETSKLFLISIKISFQ